MNELQPLLKQLRQLQEHNMKLRDAIKRVTTAMDITFAEESQLRDAVTSVVKQVHDAQWGAKLFGDSDEQLTQLIKLIKEQLEPQVWKA